MKNRLYGRGLLDSTFSLKPLVDHLRQLHFRSIGPAVKELGAVLETVDHHPKILGRFKDFSRMGDITDLRLWSNMSHDFITLGIW